jgi:hypothetical protein
MGIGIGFSRDRYRDRRVSSDRYKEADKLPNPDPTNYVITESLQIGNVLLVKIRYPDCTNYEGLKILVYENTNVRKLLAQRKIDPHFSENAKYKSPLARFEPTDHGWICAKALANILRNKP